MWTLMPDWVRTLVVCFMLREDTQFVLRLNAFVLNDENPRMSWPIRTRPACSVWQLAQSIVFGEWKPGFSMRNAASTAACCFSLVAAFALATLTSNATSSVAVVSGVKPPEIGAANPEKKLPADALPGRVGITIAVVLPVASISKPEKLQTV